MLIRLLICLVALLLCGCNATVFESPPAGIAVGCDSRLVGTWRSEGLLGGSEEGSLSEKDADYFLMTRACHLLNWHTRRPFSELREQPNLQATLRFIPEKNGGLAYARTDLAARNDSEEPWATGNLLFRYVVSRERIAVYAVDNGRVARLIESKRIASGRSIITNSDDRDEEGFEPEFDNFVLGTKEQISALLESHPDIFDARPSEIFHRYRGVPPPKSDQADDDDSAGDGGEDK